MYYGYGPGSLVFRTADGHHDTLEQTLTLMAQSLKETRERPSEFLLLNR